MSEQQTHNIDIDVKSAYIDDQSNPAQDQYVFSYTVTITNRSAEPAQLISRHWIITDANGEVQEVFGEGVIGKQPYLQPGEDFSYTSGTILATPVGSMQGSYLMRSAAGRHFDAPIAPFSLATPNTLH